MFNLYFCASVLVSELILISTISIQLSQCLISKQFEGVDNWSCIFIGLCFFLYNFCFRSTITLAIVAIIDQTPVWNTFWSLIALILIIAVGIKFLRIPFPSPPVTIHSRLNFDMIFFKGSNRLKFQSIKLTFSKRTSKGL